MAKDLVAKYGKAKDRTYRESRVRKAEKVVMGVRVGGAALALAAMGGLYWWVPSVALAIGGCAVFVGGVLALILGVLWVVHNYSEARAVINHVKSAGVLEDE